MFNKLFRLIFPARQPMDLARDYNIPHQIRFNFQTKNGWIVATSDDLPGFITEAKNPQELLAMINDGILTYFDVPRRAGDIVHDRMTIDGYGTVFLGEQRQIA
ncbi:MAG: hypothetical protein WCT37_04770 [Patescibacteria group bacterium]|jgi:hypothetical protein